MNKRDFLKTSGAALAGNLLPRLSLAETPGGAATGTPRTNWSGNYTYSTDKLVTPSDTAEVSRNVAGQARLKALGNRHSFNGIADSTVEQIQLKHFDGMELDAAAKTVTVGAGVSYGQLAPYIDSRGYAVHNLASLPHIAVVGACATATHGSGVRNGNLSTAVRGFEMVLANGEVKQFSREKTGAAFDGMVVGLGALGVITKITLAVQPTFQVEQTVYENLSFSQLEHHLEEIFASGYSVSLFTDWQKHRATQVWIKRRVEAGAVRVEAAPTFYGATVATRKMHPIAELSAENCTEQQGIPGPWYERLPHFRMNFTPSSGAELQTEYFVPRARAYEAILAVEELRDRITPHLLVTELRTIAADNLWVSPCYRQDSMTIHFTWKLDWPEVKQVLPLIEAKLAPFQAKPHWAKLFTMSPTVLRSHYTRMGEFKALLAQYDPTGKFRNAFLQTNLYDA